MNGPIAAEYGSAAEALRAIQPMNTVQWATLSYVYAIVHTPHGLGVPKCTKSYTKVYIMIVIRHRGGGGVYYSVRYEGYRVVVCTKGDRGRHGRVSEATH